MFLIVLCCLVPRCNSTVTCINIVIYSLLLYTEVICNLELYRLTLRVYFINYIIVLCYFWLLYHHYIIVSSLYHHYIIIGLQPADSRKDSLKKGGRLTCVNNKYRLFFGGGFTPGRLQYIPIAIQL